MPLNSTMDRPLETCLLPFPMPHLDSPIDPFMARSGHGQMDAWPPRSTLDARIQGLARGNPGNIPGYPSSPSPLRTRPSIFSRSATDITLSAKTAYVHVSAADDSDKVKVLEEPVKLPPHQLPDESAPITSDTSAAWARCAKDLWEHDEAAVKEWKEEIDTLLVFAGLFSAVLTTFSAQTTFSASGLAENSPPLFVVTNALWFASLVCSLAAASIGISVKQWLNYYATRNSAISRQSVRIRQFRNHGLIRWRVVDIKNLLPVLLQVALSLFFLGLLMTLWTMNKIVASITTALVVSLLTFTACTMMLPAFAYDSPYKSAPAWWFFLIAQWIKRGFNHRLRDPLDRIVHQEPYILSAAPGDPLGARHFRNWTEREIVYVRSLTTELDPFALATADETMIDDDFLAEVIRPCLMDIALEDALRCLYAILEYRAHKLKDGIPDWNGDEHDGYAIVTLAQMTIDMLARITPADHDAAAHQRRLLELLNRLFDARPIGISVGFGRLLGVLAGILREDLPVVADVRERAFAWIIKLALSHEIDNVKKDDVQAIIAYASVTREVHNGPTYLRACLAGLYVSELLVREEDYKSLRTQLKDMLDALEGYLSVPASQVINDRESLISFICFLPSVVKLAKRDAGLLSADLLELLESVFHRYLDALSASVFRRQDLMTSPRIQRILNDLHDLRKELHAASLSQEESSLEGQLKPDLDKQSPENASP